MNRNESQEGYDDLIQGYLDGELSLDEEKQFRDLLADPSFCERLACFALDFASLRELGELGVLAADLIPEKAEPETDSQLPGKNWMWTIARVAALFVLCGGLIFWFARHGSSSQLARIEESVSTEILRGGKKTETAQPGSKFRSGDTLRTKGHEVGSCATLIFDDGTRLVLASDTSVTISEVKRQKNVVLHYGDLDADAAPQPPGKPLILVTAQAEVRVMGTQLSLSAKPESTSLGVTEGHVLMKRLSDGKAVEVKGGYQTLASPKSDMTPQLIPPTPDVWSADFEEGLPEGWRWGQWVSSDLPNGSSGGVRASRKVGVGGRIYYEIGSNKTRIPGLFRIEEDTCINFRYKLEKPGWMNLFLVVGNVKQLGQSQPGNHAHSSKNWWNLPAGEWNTASILLSEFHKVFPEYKTNPRIPPQVGDVVNNFFFSVPERDRGMVIDRIWVTRGEPGSNDLGH